MAKPAWLNIAPASGSGNGTIGNSAAAHTGRLARTGLITVTGAGVGTPATYNVTQSPKSEFVSFDNESVSVGKNGGNLTITGKTNTTKLKFNLVEGGELTIVLPPSYNANGIATNNDTIIVGDPGAVSEIAFSLEVQNIATNGSVKELVKSILVTANGGQTSQMEVRQASGDATLSVSPTEITITQDGSAVSVAVTSNTSWTVA